jgi:hypothetical protein
MKWIAAAIVVASLILSGTAYAISKESPKDRSITNTNYNYSCGTPSAYGDQCATP